MTQNGIIGTAGGVTVFGATVDEIIEKTKKIAEIVERKIKLDVQLGKELYDVYPDGTVERDRSREHSFEVGGIYTHAFYPSEKRVKFECISREGNHIVLKEVRGKRVFEGEVTRVRIYGGYNEDLDVGIIHFPDYDLVDSIVAHDFLHDGEVA